MPASASRSTLIARAFALEWLTIAWMIVEGAVAITAGLSAHSTTLVAFGADSVIEMLSAFVLLWRLDVEVRRGVEFSERAEMLASRSAGGLLFALAVYVTVTAAWSLWSRAGETFSVTGLAVSIVAIPTMYLLAKAKLRLAGGLGSAALRADAAEALTCGYLSAVVVVGLLADLAFHAWWIDGVTSLGIVSFLVREGREAWLGEDCCGDGNPPPEPA